ncbi:MAG: hypothetical protein JW953_12010 [Anaerolineae bacterium]|nr:hypothetical protein [Anaerolineae bacterium]
MAITLYWLVVGTVVLIVLLFALIQVLKVMSQIVPQDKRLVIYRLGKFSRVAGPGPVQVIPGLETVEKTIEVRDHPLEVTVPGLFAFGLPNELTLNMWCSFDLVQAAGGDRNRLAQFVLMSEAERRQQVQVKMREALVRQISDLQERMPISEKANLMERLVALAPGTPRYNELLKGLKYDLAKTLPSVGVILNTDHPIVLTNRNISEEIGEGFKRMRSREMDSEWLMEYAHKLRQQYPGMSTSMLTQMLLSIEGVDVGQVQRMLLEQEKGVEAEVEFEMSGDGSSWPNIITKPMPQTQRQTAPAPTPRHLTKEDLAILKRVPPSDQEQRLVA